MTFPCHLQSGEIRRFSGQEIYKMGEEHPQLYEELFRLNPGLREWYLAPEFPPVLLRGVTQLHRKRQR